MPKSAALCNRPALSCRNTANRGKIRAVDRPRTKCRSFGAPTDALAGKLFIGPALGLYRYPHRPPRPTTSSPIWIVSASPTRPCAIRRCSRWRKPHAARRDSPAGITKNLFLRDKKGALYLVVAPEDAAIELKSLHRLLGATGRFSFGSAELMRETAGRRAGLGDAVCGDQRSGRPGDGGARRRHDGARRCSIFTRW